jgi:hypothetical protein
MDEELLVGRHLGAAGVLFHVSDDDRMGGRPEGPCEVGVDDLDVARAELAAEDDERVEGEGVGDAGGGADERVGD